MKILMNETQPEWPESLIYKGIGELLASS